MRLIREQLSVSAAEGLAVKEIRDVRFACPWHVHPEFELILTLHCPGYRLVGDRVTPLDPGDLVFLGPNLPHVWRWEKPASGAVRPAHILLAQFEPACLGTAFWELPALRPVRRLFKRAEAGLRVGGRTRDRVERCLREMLRAGSLKRLALLLTVLECLASSAELEPIATRGTLAQPSRRDEQRMDRVLDYLHRQADPPPRLPEAARLAGLSAGAFSRFFHRHTGRTFPRFVNELRLERACRLLAEGTQKVIDIAHASGFANLANFNRQFRRLKGLAPREYRRRLEG